MSDLCFQLKSIPVEINPSTMTNPTPITLSKDQLTRYISKNDRSSMLLIEVTYAEYQNGNNDNSSGMLLFYVHIFSFAFIRSVSAIVIQRKKISLI